MRMTNGMKMMTTANNRANKPNRPNKANKPNWPNNPNDHYDRTNNHPCIQTETL